MLSYSAEVVLQMLRPEIARLRAEVKRLRDEAAARDREWRECCFVKDRAMADLSMEIARLRAEIGGGR